MGSHSLQTYTVGIMDVEVPKKMVIGGVDQGFLQSMLFFDFTRPWVAAMILGTAQCCLDMALEYSKERDIFERKLTDFQAHRFRLAEMEKLIQGTRYLVYKAAWIQDKGESDPLLSSCAKWSANDLITKIRNEALLIHGGYGYKGLQDRKNCTRFEAFRDCGRNLRCRKDGSFQGITQEEIKIWLC